MKPLWTLAECYQAVLWDLQHRRKLLNDAINALEAARPLWQVPMTPTQGIEAPSGGETLLSGSTEGESPVREADAPMSDVPAREVAERGQ